MRQENRSSTRWLSKVAELLGMASQIERRDYRRVRAEFRATLSGDCTHAAVRGMDVSRQGAKVIAEQTFTEGLLVFVRLIDLGLAGFAHVRRCEPLAEGGFAVGLEFRDKLHREHAEAGACHYQKRSLESYGVWDAAADM
jgi:PilZ domain